jgi:hypothetical protein
MKSLKGRDNSKDLDANYKKQSDFVSIFMERYVTAIGEILSVWRRDMCFEPGSDRCIEIYHQTWYW